MFQNWRVLSPQVRERAPAPCPLPAYSFWKACVYKWKENGKEYLLQQPANCCLLNKAGTCRVWHMTLGKGNHNNVGRLHNIVATSLPCLQLYYSKIGLPFSIGESTSDPHFASTSNWSDSTTLGHRSFIPCFPLSVRFCGHFKIITCCSCSLQAIGSQ